MECCDVITLMKRFLNLLALPLLLATTIPARAESPLPSPAPRVLSGKTLKVGISLDEPFDMQKGGVYQGYCIDLWQALAADLGLSFEYVLYTSFDALLKATEEGSLDVNANSLYITSDRLKRMEFVLPFLQGGMQIMISEKRSDSFTRLWRGLGNSGHLKIFGIGIGVILLGTVLLTLGERRWNSEYHKDWANGLAESFYHVMSICMTGKSSHKPLPGPLGKVMAGIWIAFGVAVVAYITSSITSVMTVNRLHSMINGPQDLPSHRVAAVRGTVAETYCQDNHLDCLSFKDLQEAVTALLDRRVDAVVHDAMSLQWYDNSHPELPITEVGPIFQKKYCAFALPLKSPLQHRLSMALLKRHESGFTELLRKRYFGDL